MIDYSELRRLAETAPEGPWFGPEYAPGTSYVFDVDLGTLLEYQSIDSEKDACLRYVAAANPAVMLGLIGKLEQLSNNRDMWRGQCERQSEMLRLAHEMVDQCKAECEGLRLDAERYRAIRDCDEIFIRYTDGNDIHLIREPEQLNALADAAMSKDGQR